jgi:hypothetical protein
MDSHLEVYHLGSAVVGCGCYCGGWCPPRPSHTH